MFTAFDYAVMAVMGLSALRGAWRGFIGEIFGLIGWIAALLVACRYVDRVVPFIPANWPGGALTRSLGLMFGLVRGVVLVLILVVLGGLTELPQQDFWRHALLRPYAVQGVLELKPLLPEALASYVHV